MHKTKTHNSQGQVSLNIFGTNLVQCSEMFMMTRGCRETETVAATPLSAIIQDRQKDRKQMENLQKDRKLIKRQIVKGYKINMKLQNRKKRLKIYRKIENLQKDRKLIERQKIYRKIEN